MPGRLRCLTCEGPDKGQEFLGHRVGQEQKGHIMSYVKKSVATLFEDQCS
jgi:hypothetical protein